MVSDIRFSTAIFGLSWTQNQCNHLSFEVSKKSTNNVKRMEPTRSRIKTCNWGHAGKCKLAKSQFVLVWLRVSPHLRCCTCFSCVVIGSCVVPLCEEELRQRSLSSSYWIGLENRFQINQLQHRTVPCQLETIRVSQITTACTFPTDLFCRQKNKIAKPSL